MKRYCIYKLKEGKTLNILDEQFSKYVYIEDFGHNPLQEYQLNCVFRFIDIEDMERVSQIMGFYFVPCDIFEGYFEFYMDVDGINEKLRELELKEN